MATMAVVMSGGTTIKHGISASCWWFAAGATDHEERDYVDILKQHVETSARKLKQMGPNEY